MTLEQGKLIEPLGSPSGGIQLMQSTEFGLSCLSEYEQTDPQLLTAGVPTDITCDGGEFSKIVPASADAVWDTSLSQFNITADEWYEINVEIEITPTINNTTVELSIVTGTETLQQTIFLSRSGVSESITFTFSFFGRSTGNPKLEAVADKTSTIDNVIISAKRIYAQ